MKDKVQWIIGIVIALLLMLPCSNVQAVNDVFVLDECELLTTEELFKLNEQANQIKDDLGYNAMYIAIEDMGDQDGFDYADLVYNSFYEGEPGVVLLRDHQEKMNYVNFLNGLEEYVTDAELDEALDNYLDGSSYYDGVQAYLTSVSKTFKRINQDYPDFVAGQGALPSDSESLTGKESTTEEASTTAEEGTTEETATTATLSGNQKELPYLVDMAHVFGQEDSDQIEQKLQTISQQEQCDVVVVFVDSLGDKTATEFADDYYDDNGYGYGASHDGILLLISTGERDYAISTTGFGITAFTDAGLVFIVEQMIGDLGDDDFYSAVITFVNLSEQFIQQAKTGEPYDVDNVPKMPLNPLVYLVEVVAGFAIAFGLAIYQKSKLTSVYEQASAADYTKQGSLVIHHQHDQFINRVTTSRVIETKNSSGGSSTHSGSLGTSHGGTSGSF
ncbi:Uncharacterized membrane protein YgcG, contains a TPM-fold domain [Granulicatella balaenopterae]|uniref:Uncharacterized membrane protein YgcG, contains a TPM-fold domain n=1 Tax=Granulicatella balaenopterae TaxID=137733 RepID=A0A1H9IRN3_9LACT|nr:TPM domain-containing protein [Granulicatella balaenopterae]SEQ77177.1 Uncharacterized membrane protein YgcG, contains a TPM-fold domain [Granulicatella balaenopterae]